MAAKKIQKKPRRGRRALFILLAMALPLLLLGIVELVCRLKGYGGYPDFLRKVGRLPDGATLCIVEPTAAKPYFFANPNRPGYPDQSHFLMPKPPGTYRIFLLGESAAKGYPQPRNLAMGSFLRVMLQDALADKTIEVIDLGTTAIASFPIRYMAEEALDHQPDLMVVYAGNNEFFGSYGVASINGAGQLPAAYLKMMRAARGLALVQALDSWVYRKNDDSKTLMEQMVARTFIPESSELRTAAAKKLEQNLTAIAGKARAAGVPIILCTTASNEAGMAPIGEDDHGVAGKPVPKASDAGFLETIARMEKDPRASITELETFLTRHPLHATAHFHLGRAHALLGDPAAARPHFLRARDLDTMPWRPTSATEEGIRRAASSSGAVLCDIAGIFREMSPEGATSWELMDDHVHLSLRGQAEASRAIARTMAAAETIANPLGLTKEAVEKLPDWETYADRQGRNFFDDYRVNHTMRVLFGVPFMKRSNPEAFARFERLVADAEAKVDPEILSMMRAWQSSVPHAGGQRPLTAMVARVFLRRKDAVEALRYYRIAQTQVPSYTSWHLEYRYSELACRQMLEGILTDEEKMSARAAIAEGNFLLAHGFTGTGLARRHVGRLHQLLHEHELAIPHLEAARKQLWEDDLVACDQALAVAYVETRQHAKARALAETGIRESGKFAPAYEQILEYVRRYE
jgi:lysophospholipase L1-like esterase